MFVGSVLSSHPSLTGTQAVVYAEHGGHLWEVLRDTRPGIGPVFLNLTEPAGDCIAYTPFVLWGDDPGPTPIRVFCTTSAGQLAAALLNPVTRAPMGWEAHTGAGIPAMNTPPGASVTFPPSLPVQVLREFSSLVRDLLGVGATTSVSDPSLMPRRSVFIGGVDGSLWERTRVDGSFSWISHGTPPGTLVAGEPMTDPALVPPASPLRIFATDSSGGIVERIIGGPSGVTWVNHGRPPGPAGLANVSSGGIVVANLAAGLVHVIVQAGGWLQRLTITALGSPGFWIPLGTTPSPRTVFQTEVTSSPGAATIFVGPSSVYVSFFIVASRRAITADIDDTFADIGDIAGRTIDEVWFCGHDFRTGTVAYLSNLGPPGRPALTGTNEYIINAVRGHSPTLRRVYGSSRPSQGGTESLDEWTYDLAPIGSAALGLPPTVPACVPPPGGPRNYGVGPG